MILENGNLGSGGIYRGQACKLGNSGSDTFRGGTQPSGLRVNIFFNRFVKKPFPTSAFMVMRLLRILKPDAYPASRAIGFLRVFRHAAPKTSSL